MIFTGSLAPVLTRGSIQSTAGGSTGSAVTATFTVESQTLRIITRARHLGVSLACSGINDAFPIARIGCSHRRNVMKLTFKFLLSASFIFAANQVAGAQTCPSYPNTLTNGTTADATAVMGNFNSILNCANTNLASLAALPLRGYLSGLALSNDSSSPNSVIDVAVGGTASDDATTLMNLTSGYTKSLLPWGVGSGSGGLDTGSAAANTWYHLFVIERTDTAVVDILISTSATLPTLPTSYMKKRRIGSIKTDASSHILAFTQTGDQFAWSAVVQDVNNAPISTTALTPALTVPPNVSVNALFNVVLYNAAGVTFGLISTLDTASTPANTPAGNYNLYAPGANFGATGQFNIKTSNQEIRIISGQSGSNYFIVTFGWIDARGKV